MDEIEKKKIVGLTGENSGGGGGYKYLSLRGAGGGQEGVKG